MMSPELHLDILTCWLEAVIEVQVRLLPFCVIHLFNSNYGAILCIRQRSRPTSFLPLRMAS